MLTRILLAALFTVSLSVQASWAQQSLAPPAPPSAEEEEEEKTAAEIAKERAEREAKAREERAKQHCSKRVADSCESLDELVDIGDAAWQVGVYGAAMCVRSKEIETSRDERKRTIEYEENLRDIAEDEGREMEPYKPFETNQAFNQRTTNECNTNLTHYCSQMVTTASQIPGPDGELTMQVVDMMCGSNG